MDIKEIALKHSREYLTFKLGGRKGLDVAEIVCDDEIYAEIVDELAQQFEALIESYKAELLKEVGEPVLYAEFAEDGGWLGDASEYADHLEEPHALFTSDQVAAAIIKATKPLEDQLAAAQEEITRLGKLVISAQNAAIENAGEVKSLKDQLASCEQRVAEACAKWIDGYAGIHQKEMLSDTAKSFADALRRGEWRKFVKDV